MARAVGAAVGSPAAEADVRTCWWTLTAAVRWIQLASNIPGACVMLGGTCLLPFEGWHRWTGVWGGGEGFWRWSGLLLSGGWGEDNVPRAFEALEH